MDRVAQLAERAVSDPAVLQHLAAFQRALTELGFLGTILGRNRRCHQGGQNQPDKERTRHRDLRVLRRRTGQRRNRSACHGSGLWSSPTCAPPRTNTAIGYPTVSSAGGNSPR